MSPNKLVNMRDTIFIEDNCSGGKSCLNSYKNITLQFRNIVLNSNKHLRGHTAILHIQE